MKSKCLSNYELHTVLRQLLHDGSARAGARHVCARLEAVLGCQLLVLGPEGVHPVNHLLDQLHLGVAQPVLVRDVVGHAYTINQNDKHSFNFVYFNFMFLSYKESNERLNCAVCDQCSVANPGCLSRIRLFFHPGSEIFPSRIRVKEFKYFIPKKRFPSASKYDPGCSSRIRILVFYPSRIPDPGVKRVPDLGSGSATQVTILPKFTVKIKFYEKAMTKEDLQ